MRLIREQAFLRLPDDVVNLQSEDFHDEGTGLQNAGLRRTRRRKRRSHRIEPTASLTTELKGRRRNTSVVSEGGVRVANRGVVKFSQNLSLKKKTKKNVRMSIFMF